MSATKFRLLSPEESAALEAEQKQHTPKRPPRFRCHCGRFVKANTYWRRGPNQIGMSSWGWHCTQCGDMIERT
ncbi:hypothetical protein ACMTN4_07350 [Rhodococcus globerulus]|uniref:hypothetical protein n=1 Tax=Rhodococcus globerulus TaxID=33008 RepID=UPI0039E72BF5